MEEEKTIVLNNDNPKWIIPATSETKTNEKTVRQMQVERAMDPRNKLSDVLKNEQPAGRIEEEKEQINEQTLSDGTPEPQKSSIEQTRENRAAVTKQRADAAFEDYYKMRQVKGNDFTTADVDAALGNNTRAFQKQYMNGKGNFGTALGAGAIWGAVNPNTLATLDRMYQTRIAEEQAKEADRNKMSRVIGKFGNVNITNGDKRTIVNQFGDTNGDVKMTPELKAELERRGITDENDQWDMIDLLNQKPPTFEELMAQREHARAELDYKNQQRLIERRRNLQGLSELGALIGDIIKASGGAVVTPRDLQSKYDQLSKQEQANYDAYLARMEKIKADAEAERKRQAERAQAIADRDETRAYNERLYQQKLEDEKKIAEKNQQYQLELIKARSDAKLKQLEKRASLELSDKNMKTVTVWFRGTRYNVNKDSIETVLSAVRPHLGLKVDELSKLLGNDMTKSQLIAETCSALEDYSTYLSEETCANIDSLLSRSSVSVEKSKTKGTATGGATGTGAGTNGTGGGAKGAGNDDNTGGMFE